MSWWSVQEVWWLTVGSILLLAGVFTNQKRAYRMGKLSLGIMWIALVMIVFFQPIGTAFGGAYVSTGLTTLLKVLFVLSAIISTWIAHYEQITTNEQPYVREAVVLPWFILAGMGLMASARDFTLLFVSLELVTVTFYILVSLRRKDVLSVEAGIKYLITGALSTGFLVFGIALIYGVTGSLQYDAVEKFFSHSTQQSSGSTAIHLGILLLLASLGFKVAVVPFHWWAPDVYQGAPTSVTTFVSTGSKAAGFSVLITLFQFDGPLFYYARQNSNLLLTVATLSILFGSLAGLAQRDLKRLVAYSGINNSGFILLALSALNSQAAVITVFYLYAYSFASLLLLFMVGYLSAKAGKNTLALTDISGLASKNPALSWSLVVALTSLAGVPPTVGFWGKWFVLSSALDNGHIWAVVVAVIGAIAALVYYLGIVRAVFFEEMSATLKNLVLERLTFFYRLGLSTILVVCVVISITPNILLSFLNAISK